MSGSSARSSWRITPAAAAGVVGGMLLIGTLVAWVGAIVAGLDPLQGKDWVRLHRAGSLWWSDEVAQVYSGSMDSSRPFVHPPYFIWFCVPLGLMDVSWTAFALFTLVSAASCAAAVSLLVASMSGRAGQCVTAALVVFASGPWTSCMVTGQVAALPLLAIACALMAWQRDHSTIAGLCLSVVAIKPQLLLPLAALVVIARDGRMVRGVCAGAALLLASTIPWGLPLWRDYFAATAHVSGVLSVPTEGIWNHRTLLASLSWILGRPAGSPAVIVTWLTLVSILTIGVIRTWWRGRSDQRPRLLGIAVLFVVAASPYLFFYDGLLLAVPGVVWWLQGGAYASRRRRLGCGALLGVTYGWEFVDLVIVGGGLPPIAGALVACWLVVEVRDLRQVQRAQLAGSV